MSAEYELTKAVSAYTLNSMAGYKYKPWEKRKLEEKIERLIAERELESLRRLEAFLEACNNPKSKIHWTINAGGLQ